MKRVKTFKILLRDDNDPAVRCPLLPVLEGPRQKAAVPHLEVNEFHRGIAEVGSRMEFAQRESMLVRIFAMKI